MLILCSLFRTKIYHYWRKIRQKGKRKERRQDRISQTKLDKTSLLSKCHIYFASAEAAPQRRIYSHIKLQFLAPLFAAVSIGTHLFLAFSASSLYNFLLSFQILPIMTLVRTLFLSLSRSFGQGTEVHPFFRSNMQPRILL